MKNFERLEADSLDERTKARLCERIGDDLCDFKAYPSAVKYYELAVEALNLSGGSRKLLSALYQSIAATHADLGNFVESLLYYSKGEKFEKCFHFSALYFRCSTLLFSFLHSMAIMESVGRFFPANYYFFRWLGLNCFS